MEFKKGVLGINDERYRYDRNDSMMISSVSVCALPSDLPLPRVSIIYPAYCNAFRASAGRQG